LPAGGVTSSSWAWMVGPAPNTFTGSFRLMSTTRSLPSFLATRCVHVGGNGLVNRPRSTSRWRPDQVVEVDDRAAFDAHMAKVRAAPDATQRAVTRDGRLVGNIAWFVLDGRTEITYWIDRSVWGQGIASRAIALLLATVPVRPLYARAASDNLGSLRVLVKAGFTVIGTEIAYATARDADIEETILRLD